MNRFSTTLILTLAGFLLTSCDTPVTSTSTVTDPAKKPSPAASVQPASLVPGTFRVYIDGNFIFSGLNPVVEYSDTDKKFTFYSTFYTKDVLNKFSYASFELKNITKDQIPEGLDIATDPNIKITGFVSLNTANSPGKNQISYSAINLDNTNITTNKYAGTLKATLSFKAQSTTNVNADFSLHDVGFDFEVPYEKGKLKTFAPGSLEIRENVGYYKK